ncbi:hypothetical protein DOE51_09335 [Bdellovibrio sp. NC01]|nr:hypothetical protein DOE51_09335 [Bdellovibrio sp. NC01]
MYVLAAAMVSFNVAQAAEVSLWGISQTNAALITESLIEKASSDSSIKVDTSVYTITKVTREDSSSRIECKRLWFGGTPPQYDCSITNK